VNNPGIPPEAEVLGPLIRDCPSNSRQIAKVLLLTIGAPVLYWVMIFFAWRHPVDQAPPPDAAPRETVLFVLVLVGGVAQAFLLAYLWWAASRRDLRLLVMSEGLACLERGCVRTCRWEEIREVVLVPNHPVTFRLKLSTQPDLVVCYADFPLEDMQAFKAALQERTESLSEPPPWTIWQPSRLL
jgi:hypothetical protein